VREEELGINANYSEDRSETIGQKETAVIITIYSLVFSDRQALLTQRRQQWG